MNLYVKHSFRALRPEWERLYAMMDDCSPFLNPSAFEIAYKYFYPYYIARRCRPVFAMMQQDGVVRAILPLLKFSDNRYELFGNVNGFNECGMLYDGHAILPEVIDLVRQHFGEVEFMKIDESSPLAMFKGESARESDNVSICFGNDFEEYFKSFSKSVRQNVRTAYNRMKTDGLSFKMEYFTPHSKKNAGKIPIGKLINLYVKRHSERYGVRTSPLKKWFLQHQNFATRYYLHAQNAFTSVLYIGSEIGAFLSGLYNEHTLIVPRLSVNSECLRYSPGLVLICETIKQLQQSTSIRCLDLSLGDEPYKYQLGGKCHKSYRFKI